MERKMEIYTKTGDKGTTSLYDGVRVAKDDARVEAYGTVDELGAALGVAINLIDRKDMKGELLGIKNKLFTVNENLATEDQSKVGHHITEEDIKVLERMVDKYMEEAGQFVGFILTGTSPAAAALDLARAICRRAERRIITFANMEGIEVDPLVRQFINRLADTLYACMKACEDEKIMIDFDREFFMRE